MEDKILLDRSIVFLADRKLSCSFSLLSLISGDDKPHQYCRFGNFCKIFILQIFISELITSF